MVRMPRLELGTSRLSGVRSNQLSYTRALELLVAVPFGQAGNKITVDMCRVNGGRRRQSRGKGAGAGAPLALTPHRAARYLLL